MREHLRLRLCDRLEFVIKDDVVIQRRPARKVTNIKGFLPKPKRPVSLAETDKAIRQRADM